MANIFSNAWNSIKDIFWIPTQVTPGSPSLKEDLDATPAYMRAFGGSENVEENLNVFRAPIDIPRMKQDMANWRLGVSEAERQIIPYRYIMQQMYLDTALDTQIQSAWETRLGLSLLKHFKVTDKEGNELEDWTDYFERDWFDTFITHALNAILYGYSLISLGSIVDNEFQNIVVVRRGNINPDSYLVTPVPRTTNGIDFRTEPYCNNHIWVPTINPHAQSNCGYGLFYLLTPLAIRLKNNLTYNCDYNQKFGMPFRFMTTPEKNEVEKAKKVAYLENMGDSGWMLADEKDTLEFITGGNGSGHDAFPDLEKRLHQDVNKMLLGHADAIDSAGKSAHMNGSSGISGNPQEKALDRISTSDGAFLKAIIEKDLFRIIRYHGIKANDMELPKDARFEWDNDKEKAEEDTYRNEENIKIATFISTLANAGFIADPKWIEEVTGVKLSDEENLLTKKGQFWIADQEAKADAKEETAEGETETSSDIKNYLNVGKKPLHITPEAWEAYKRDLEYKKKTKGFDGDKYGLTKEEYTQYAENIKRHIDNDIPLGRGYGQKCNLHINCGCYISEVDGRWQFSAGDNPGPTTCQNCIDAGNDYEAARRGGHYMNLLNIIEKHKHIHE